LGAVAQFIISILIALAVIIVVLWIIPFTWGAAVANTVIFVALAIQTPIREVHFSNKGSKNLDLSR
jgi:hypothetical protein